MQGFCLDNIKSQKRLLHERGICVIIPTYNNERTVVDVVKRALEQCDDVIVVCDGCTDNTIALLSLMEQNAIILDLGTNKGKGVALKAGFKYAIEKGFAYAITLDSDGQHFPEDIPQLLEANLKNPGALIVGQRKDLEKAERSKGSKFANAFSNFWFTIQTGHYMPDTQTGYRLYPLKKLRGLSLLTSRYEAELELMVLASWHGVKLVSVPVNVFYPSKEERVSHFHPIKDFTRISVLNSVLCILALIYGLPLAICRIVCRIMATIYSFTLFLISITMLLTPATFIYLNIGGITEQKKIVLHKTINRMARFIQNIHGMPGVKFSMSNQHEESFDKPAVIISNHQSHLDLISILALTPKLIILTADWVWNNAFYGFIVRNIEFLPASQGIENILPQLKSLVERGYSVVVFPEGTRSLTCDIGRFHQGAFLLADKLALDILPVVQYGPGKVLPKHGRYLRKGKIHTEVLKRIDNATLRTFGVSYKEQASFIKRLFIEQYQHLANKIEQNV